MSIREVAPAPRNRSGAEGAPEAWVHRFGRTERFVHWWTVMMLSIAVPSGFGMGHDGGSGPMLIVHVGAAVLLIGLLLAAHVFMAVVNPSTRPALHGMVFGRVRRSWAAQHHLAWLDSLERQHPHQKSQ